MMGVRRAVVFAIPILAIVAAGTTPAAQGSRATIYATVLNEQDRPVRGLQSADLVLRDGGVRQGIVDAQPAREPLAVAIVVSGFDAAELTSLRPALVDAASKLRAASPATQVGLIGAGPAVVMIEPDQTAWVSALDATATASGQTIVDRIITGCDALAAAPPDRRTVVAILKTGAAAVDRPDRLSVAVDSNHVALWTVELGAAGASGWAKPVNTALDDAVRIGGSMRQAVTSPDAIDARLGVVVDCLLAQYLVTYEWPDPMLSTFSLVTRHDVGRVLTPSWSK